MGDNGRIISPELEDAIREYLSKTNPVWERFRSTLPPPRPLTRRQRLSRLAWRLRERVADQIGGGTYYTEGCDCDR